MMKFNTENKSNSILGTGKTATFTVGILQRLDPDVKQCQSLVLAPTRELAQQIVKVIGALGKKKLLHLCCACISSI